MSKVFVRPLLCAAAIATLFAATTALPTIASAKGAKGALRAEIADSAKCKGEVTAVDAKAGSITIHSKKDGDMTLTTTSATRIKVNRAPGSLTDIQVGMRAMIRTADKKTALVVNAHDPKKEDK